MPFTGVPWLAATISKSREQTWCQLKSLKEQSRVRTDGAGQHSRSQLAFSSRYNKENAVLKEVTRDKFLMAGRLRSTLLFQVFQLQAKLKVHSPAWRLPNVKYVHPAF